MDHISTEEMQGAVTEFKRMASLADALEDICDDEGALAIRVALYDRIQDTIQVVEARVGKENMEKMAADGMDRTAAGGFVNTLKGIGGGLWDAIARGKAPKGLGDIAKKGEEEGAAWLPKMMRKFVNPATEGRPARPGVANQYGVDVPGIKEIEPKGPTLTGLGRATAIGGTAAAGLGAASLLGGGRKQEQQMGGPGEIPYPSSGPRPPSNWPTSGGMDGGPSGSGGMGGGMRGSGGFASEGAQMQQISGAMNGIAAKVQELDGRVSRLEGSR